MGLRIGVARVLGTNREHVWRATISALTVKLSGCAALYSTCLIDHVAPTVVLKIHFIEVYIVERFNGDLCPVKVDELTVLSNHHADISYIAAYKARLTKPDQSLL